MFVGVPTDTTFNMLKKIHPYTIRIAARDKSQLLVATRFCVSYENRFKTDGHLARMLCCPIVDAGPGIRSRLTVLDDD